MKQTQNEGEEERKIELKVINERGQPEVVSCAGDYCHQHSINLNKDITDFHFKTIMKLISETNEAKFIIDKGQPLPLDSNGVYKVAKMVLMLDRDIKNIWEEEALNQRKLKEAKNVNDFVL